MLDNRRRLAIVCAILVTAASSLVAQQSSWKTYTNMSSVRELIVRGSAIWVATSGGVYRFELSDSSYTLFTNVDGLASNDIQTLTTDSAGRIYAGAANGSISIYERGRGWKQVLDIFQTNDRPKRGIRVFRFLKSLLYIGTDYGISVYDPERSEFRDSYVKFGQLPSQSEVNDIFFTNDALWVATENGVATALLSSSNLQDPQNWTSYTTKDGLPTNQVVSVTQFQNEIVSGGTSGLSVLRQGMWSRTSITDQVLRLKMTNDKLFVLTPKVLFQLSSLSTISNVGEDLYQPHYPVGLQFTELAVEENGEILVATSQGVATYHANQPWYFRAPNMPSSNIFSKMFVDSRDFLWTSGSGIDTYDGSKWSNLTDGITVRSSQVGGIAESPDGSIWLATYGEGVLRQNPQGKFFYYDRYNVPGFPEFSLDPKFMPTTGVAIGQDGNPWFTHRESNGGKALSMYDIAADAWYFFVPKFQYTSNVVSGITVDEFDRKWYLQKDGPFQGVVIFDDSKSPGTLADDSWQTIPANGATNLNAAEITSIAVDLVGDLWFGTEVGLRTIFNPSTPDKITRTCYNTRCNIEGEKVNCIAIDAVNNKWLGTESGVFLLSPDGSEILAHYNTDNSHLVDNGVKAIVIHPKTGVAYFGTNRGLSALSTPFARSKASFETLRVSPNPFKIGVDEKITIDGLVEGSSLKILTVSGALVTEIPSPGGRLGFWDGKSEGSNYVPSGIYFIVAYGADGTQVSVTKVAVVHP